MNIPLPHLLTLHFPNLIDQPDKLKAFLQFNKVLPMYYEEAKNEGRDVDFLKESNRHSVMRSMQMEVALKLMLPLFAQHGIRVVLLKGSALGAYIYPSPSMRPMVDIDLLIAKDDIPKARKMLIDAGASETYQTESEHTMGHWQHSPPLYFKTVSVELHHQLFHTYERVKVPTSELFENTSWQSMYGLQVEILKPEYQLLHIGYHMYHHAEGGDIRLIWLFDIHLLLQKSAEEFDWQKFTFMVKANGVEMPFIQILDACHLLLGTIIPESFLLKTNADAGRSLKRSGQRPLKSDVARGYTEQKSYAEHQQISDQNLQWFLQLCLIPDQRPVKIGSIRSLQQIEGFKTKILFVGGKLFPSAIYLRHKFPNRVLPVAYSLLYLSFLKKLFIFVKQIFRSEV